MSNRKGILLKGFSINDKYSILLFIKQGSNAEKVIKAKMDGENIEQKNERPRIGFK